MMLNAIIVDDEKPARENLRALLAENCPEVTVAGMAESASEARELLELHRPDVVFLDIHMPVENGFDFLTSLSSRNFSVVFVTAYNQYAIKAIKAGAFDYLVKPIEESELKTTVRKLAQQQSSATPNNIPEKKFDWLLKQLYFSKYFQKLTVPHAKGYKVIDLEEIIFFEGNNNYTNVHLADGATVLATKTLKEFERMTGENLFFRAHKSYLINLAHFREYLHEDGGYAVMSNRKKIPVGRGRGPELIRKMNFSG